jgi:hypothetical protein
MTAASSSSPASDRGDHAAAIVEHRHWIGGKWVPCFCNHVRVVYAQGGGVVKVTVTK